MFRKIKTYNSCTILFEIRYGLFVPWKIQHLILNLAGCPSDFVAIETRVSILQIMVINSLYIGREITSELEG